MEVLQNLHRIHEETYMSNDPKQNNVCKGLSKETKINFISVTTRKSFFLLGFLSLCTLNSELQRCPGQLPYPLITAGEPLGHMIF